MEIKLNKNYVLAEKSDSGEAKVGAIILSSSKDTPRYRVTHISEKLDLKVGVGDELLITNGRELIINGKNYALIHTGEIACVF